MAKAMETLTALGRKWTKGHVTEVNLWDSPHLEIFRFYLISLDLSNIAMRSIDNFFVYQELHFDSFHQVTRDDDEMYGYFDGGLPQC